MSIKVFTIAFFWSSTPLRRLFFSDALQKFIFLRIDTEVIDNLNLGAFFNIAYR
jgi:hypothetical protein